MKVCPNCQNVIRKSKSVCPYCGYKYSTFEFLTNAIWHIVLVVLLIVVGLLILINFWGFSFY